MRARPGAIVVGAAAGVLGPALGYMVLRSLDMTVTDPLLLGCAIAPTAVFALLVLVPRTRPWAWQAAVACALATIILVLVIGGGISALAGLLSDPAPTGP